MGRGRRWVTGLAVAAHAGVAGIFIAPAVHHLFARPANLLSDAVLVDRQSAGATLRSAPRPDARALSARQLGEQILARNIFDSQTRARSQAPTEVPPSEPERPAVSTAALPPRCDASLRLVACIVDAARPERSLAAVRKDGKTQLLAPGTSLDDLTLVAVRPAYAYLHSTTGALCSLAVFAPPGERQNAPSKPSASPPQENKSKPDPKAFFSNDELERGVRSLGQSGYSLSRALVLRALTDPGKAAAGAQFRPISRDGRTLGMEVRAIRGDSLIQRLGVQNGDIVRSLNGADLTTPTGLLAALRALREADSVSMEVVRGSAVRNVQYLLE